MPEARSGEVTLSYDDAGRGPAVLLVHGHTFDRRIWEEVAPRLLAAGTRVLAVDLRGHGASTRPPAGYHVTHHAADMLAVLDAAGVERATVAGFSLGGGVALELAEQHPERVGALVLVSPVMPDRPFDTEFMDNLRQVARVARSEGIAAAMAGPWLESPLFAVSCAKPDVRRRAAAIVADFPGAEYLASERDRVERPFTVPERLSSIGVPTRVLVGEHERASFVAYAEEAVNGISGARLERLPGCGHLLPLEEPARVAEAILEVCRG